MFENYFFILKNKIFEYFKYFYLFYYFKKWLK